MNAGKYLRLIPVNGNRKPRRQSDIKTEVCQIHYKKDKTQLPLGGGSSKKPQAWEKTDKQPKQEQKTKSPNIIIHIVESNHGTLSWRWVFSLLEVYGLPFHQHRRLLCLQTKAFIKTG